MVTFQAIHGAALPSWCCKKNGQLA